MKKMRNGRRGFTLLEIVIVVAIIVILSTGAFLGVAATVNRASDAQEQLAINNGENFEAYARNQVDSYGKDMVYWDPIPNYTPENQAKKMKEQMMAEGWTDGEITFEYQSDGWHIVAEWDPTLPEHRGFQTPEDYKLWLSNYNNYIALGYSAEEIEDGCKNGSTDIKPVWDASKHGGVSEEEYLKQKQGGSQQGGNQQGGNQQGGNQQDGNQQGGNQQGGNQQGGGQQGGGQQSSTPVQYNTVTGGTVGVGSGVNGVLQYTDNSDGTTTLQLNANNGNNNGSIKLRKNANNTYSVYIVDDSWCLCGPCGYDPWNGWGSKTKQWLEIPSEDLADLCEYYGFTVN